MNNHWTVIGTPDISKGGVKVTLKSEGNDPKEVSEDIVVIAKYAYSYEQVTNLGYEKSDFKSENPVVEVEFSTLAQFEKFSKELVQTQ